MTHVVNERCPAHTVASYCVSAHPLSLGLLLININTGRTELHTSTHPGICIGTWSAWSPFRPASCSQRRRVGSINSPNYPLYLEDPFPVWLQVEQTARGR